MCDGPFPPPSPQQNTSMGGGQNSLLTFGSTVDESYDGVDIKQERRRFSGLSPVINSASLTPERFQQPVKMLNSLQQGQLQLSPATSGHVIGNSNPMMTSLSSWSGHVESMAAVNQQMMSPFGAKLERFGKEEKRRRSSSSSVAPLDDQSTLREKEGGKRGGGVRESERESCYMEKERLKVEMGQE